MAIKRTAKQRYDRTVYRCAYHHKRGHTVCSNNVEVRQDTLDSAILHAISNMLDDQVLEASIAEALERIRKEQKKLPDERVTIERELYLIETRLHQTKARCVHLEYSNDLLAWSVLILLTTC